MPLLFGLGNNQSATPTGSSGPLLFGLGSKAPAPAPAAPAPTPTPGAHLITNFASGVKSGVGAVASDVKDVWNQPAPTQVPFDAQNVLDRTQNWGEAVIKGWSDFGDSLVHPKVTDSNFATNAVSAVGDSSIKFIQAFFTPISNVFEQSATLPGPLGKIGNTVNKIFAVAGVEGADTAEGIINTLPLSQKTKDTLTPLFKQFGGLTAQIILGKGTDMIQEGVVSKTKSIIKTIATDPELKLAVQSDTPGETKIKVNTPTTKHADYAASQGYEPYTPPGELPTIEAGPKPKETLPTIQTEAPAQAPPAGMKYEQISPADISKIVDNSLERNLSGVREKSVSFFKDNPADITQIPIRVREVEGKLTIEDGRHRLQAAKELGLSHIKVEDVTPQYTGRGSAILQSIKPVPIEGAGATKVRGLSAGVEQTAIEKKLTSGFGDLPEYQSMNVKDQAKLAIELMKESYERAKNIALGREPAPQGLHPEAVFTAVEARAIKEGDVNTLRNLATRSSLTGEATTMGQRIKLLDERNPDSPVKAIRDVAKAREEAIKKRVGDVSKEIKKTAKEIKAEVDTAKPKKQDWATFIREIQC